MDRNFLLIIIFLFQDSVPCIEDNVDEYLFKLSSSDKPLFCMLLAKIIPAELNVSGTVLIDIGQAMLEAESRQKQLQATRSDEGGDIIDVKPLVIKNKD